MIGGYSIFIMGSSTTSKQQTKEDAKEDAGIVCIDCDKKTQKDLPSDNSRAASTDCKEVYAQVVACMDKQYKRVAQCKDEWREFKLCHEAKNSIVK